MNLTNAPSKIVLPFANGGGKNTIPVASQIGVTDGAASWTDGFPPLTRTPKVAGGVPPAGLDMNGVLNATSAICRWTVTGAGYTYDSTFAADANIGGYPKSARVARTDGEGYWINTTDGNTTDPEAGGAGWYPDFTVGATSITMSSSNVTLTPLQYGKQVIIITGTLSANVNLIFPALVAQWTVINNTSGNYTITCKTASGTGVVVAGVRGIVGDGTNITCPPAVGDNQSWVDMTSSRAFGTTYYNTTKKPILVNVTGTANGAAPKLTVNGVVIWGSTAISSGFYGAVSAIIPPGGSYVAGFSASMSLVAWSELK